MLILIPSRSRHDRISRGPLRQLSAAWLTKTMVACPESQHDQYKWALRAFHERGPYAGPELITVPDDWRIGRKRRFLGEYARGKDECFMFLDDDIGFLVRKSETNWQLRDPTNIEVAIMLSYAEMALMTDDALSHLGISAREGNNRIGVGDADHLRDRNTRLMRAVAWKVKPYLETDPTRVEGIEDFDCSLQSLRAGYENVCLYYWAQGQRETNESGGCADWRTAEVHAANVRKLAELHPGFVSVRQKKNKTGGLAERLESNIQWKKAAAAGKGLTVVPEEETCTS